MNAIPLIDVSPLRGSDPAAKAAVARALGKACREIGFVYVAGHGIPEPLIAEVLAAGREFFAQPAAAKQALSIRQSPHNRGYGDLNEEKLDPDGTEDCKEAFNIGLELPKGHPEEQSRGRNLWPELAGWRALMLEYFDRCWDLGRLLHRGFSLDLGIDETYFEDKLDAPQAVLRLLRYPAGSGEESASLGAGEHTDYGNITILADDGVAGLEVRGRDGRWIDAPRIPGALVCNIGDCLMRWSNDVYVSTPHRVRVPTEERLSIAFFLDPNPDALVVPIAAAGAGKYPPVTALDYVQGRLDATYRYRVLTPPP
jgi:isopenicillin N synthase-like dioxygenase